MIPGIDTGDIPGNVGNAGQSKAGGSASASNSIAGISFGSIDRSDYLLIGAIVLIGILIWKKA